MNDVLKYSGSNSIQMFQTYAGMYQVEGPRTLQLSGYLHLVKPYSFRKFVFTTSFYLRYLSRRCTLTGNFTCRLMILFGLWYRNNCCRCYLSLYFDTSTGSIVVISSVTPSFGSTSGGTKIKLTGQFFNNTEKPLRVEVGGKPCTNLKLVSDTEMTCDTPPQPASQPFYTGQGFYRNLLIF